MGNWFNQVIMIAPPKSDYPMGIATYGWGAQLKLDTASQDQFGSGRHSFVPLFAWKWQFENWSLIPIFKYEKAFGDEPSGQDKEIENFQFKPLINIPLPDKWFLSLWDSTDWVLEKNDGPNDGDWNIPLDIMVGTPSTSCAGISSKCVYSFQVIEPLVEEGDFETSDTAVQFRAGFFF